MAIKNKVLKMTTECPLCREKAFVYEYVSKRKYSQSTGLYIACGFCNTTIFSQKGVYKYLAETFPTKTTLRECSIEEFSEYKKRAGK